MRLLAAIAALLISHPAPTDATSTNTPRWACVLQHESGNGKFSPNLFQFQNTALEHTVGMKRSPGSYTRQEQDTFAIRAYAYSLRVWGNGFFPWSADSTACHLGV